MGGRPGDSVNSLVHPGSPGHASPPAPGQDGALASGPAHREPVGRLDGLCSQASEAISHAAQLLRQNAISIRYGGISGVHWYLFLDDPSPNLIETCAISTAL